MIQGETNVIKPALYLVAIRFCLGEKIQKTDLIAVYLSLLETPVTRFKLAPTGSNWKMWFGNNYGAAALLFGLLVRRTEEYQWEEKESERSQNSLVDAHGSFYCMPKHAPSAHGSPRRQDGTADTLGIPQN